MSSPHHPHLFVSFLQHFHFLVLFPPSSTLVSVISFFTSHTFSSSFASHTIFIFLPFKRSSSLSLHYPPSLIPFPPTFSRPFPPVLFHLTLSSPQSPANVLFPTPSSIPSPCLSLLVCLLPFYPYHVLLFQPSFLPPSFIPPTILVCLLSFFSYHILLLSPVVSYPEPSIQACGTRGRVMDAVWPARQAIRVVVPCTSLDEPPHNRRLGAGSGAQQVTSRGINNN